MDDGRVDNDYFVNGADSLSSLSFKQLQFNYLIASILIAVANYLPGAYRYAIYESNGISKSRIELLYICFYGSSLLIGTFVAILADKCGRRQACILCGIFYALYSISFHFHSIWIFAIATIPWGIAGTLDQIAFESWLITEHRKLSLNTQSLKHVLRNTFIARIMVSTTMAFLSQFLVQPFGYIASFDVAVVILLLMIVFILLKWSENYGNKTLSSIDSFISATKSCLDGFPIVLIGLSTSFFETVICIYSIQWTPTLESAKSMIIHAPLPLGFCYGGQMLCRFIGTLAFGPLVARFRVQSFMIIIFLLAAIGLSVPLFLPNSQWPILIGFFLYEFCVGVYRPSFGFLRSQYIPNEIRATVMSYLRVPQLILVIGLLLFHFTLSIVFIIWLFMLILAAICMIVLRTLKMPDDEPIVPVKQVLAINLPPFQFTAKQYNTQYYPTNPSIHRILL